ncbi:hypothetical protein GCM10027059_25770 [Myceligenerans halotolerans]
MADRTVKFRFGIDIPGLRAQLGAAQRAMTDFASKVESGVRDNSASIDLLSNRLATVGTVALGVAGVAVQRFAEFDKAMSSVSAATHATGAELDALREAAIRAGADTSFSASEAAGAIEELAKAGVSTTDILAGGLDGALALAAAGGIDVSEAAETAASALTQFGLKGSDVGHVADLLAAGAGKAQGGVTDLGQALNQSGLIAAQTGLTIEETTAALSAFASAGLLGSDAGTSFKTMLQVLSAPSSTAATEMERLGISAYDAQGNFVGLEALAGNLQSALEDLTPQQRNSALATIFGSDAVRAASIIYKQGAEGVREWTGAVDDQGYAAETAAIQLDNLAGDLEALGGSLDTVFIQSRGGANDVLRDMVQRTETLVDAIGEIPGPVLNATTMIAGAGGLALLGVAGLGKLTVGVVETRDAMKALGITTRTATIAVGAMGAALGVATVALTIWLQSAADAKARTEAYAATLDDLGSSTEKTADVIAESLASSTKSWVDGSTTWIDLADRMGIATEDLTGYVLGEADAVERVDGALTDYVENASVWDKINSSNRDTARSLRDELERQSESLTEAERRTAQEARAKAESAEESEGLTEATADLTAQTEEYVDVLGEAISAQQTAANGVLDLRDAQRSAEEALDAATGALKENGRTLDITTSKGRDNQAALDAIADSGWDLIESMHATGSSQQELQDTMQTTRDRFIKTAQSMGATKEQARQLADQLGLIPKTVTTEVVADTTSARNSLESFIKDASGRTIAIAFRGSLGATAMADGGAVYGGVPGRDSVPVMAMPGEHMLDVADVQAMGGQAGVYAFRQALHSGMAHFANGGAVEMTARQFVMPVAAPSSTAQPVGATTYRSITVNNNGREFGVRDLLHADRVLELQDPEVSPS